MIWKGYLSMIDDTFGKPHVVRIYGWKHSKGPGLFDSYTSALADYMGLWEEYCEYHRTKEDT